MKIKEVDAITGEEIIREATVAELEQARLDSLEAIQLTEAKATKAAEKAALLTKLGISEDEAKLLLS